MVCEPPRLRPLLVTRRGQFFEDPFFRDAWGDYNHAVRRIVDRFNHGWVSPSNRIQDSQYHSMYRTLRTARLNYSTHSARFKEEGNIYKLVMDVHEFIGGDITVRTAGSTVSVRGKVDAGGDSSDETTLTTKGGKDDDASSVSSGMSTSSRTLHRRFTLPADADCEKVESSLSKDAVLSVTIPKRTDVRYIPVTIEGNTYSQINTERNEYNMSRYGGIKRPSDSNTESNRKKPQDDPAKSTGIDRSKHEWKRTMGESRGKEDTAEIGSHRKSRYDVFYGDKPNHFQKTANGNNDPRKRTYDEAKEEQGKGKSGDQRTRRREDKYEEVHEINIPVQINLRDHNDKVFRPRSLTAEPKVHHIEIQTERPKSSVEPIRSPIKDEERFEKRIRKSSSSSQGSESPKETRKRSLKENPAKIQTTLANEPTARNGSFRDKGISLDRITNPEIYRENKRNLEDSKEYIIGKTAVSCDKENCSPIKNQRSHPEPESQGFGKSHYKPIDLDSIYTVSDERHQKLLQKSDTPPETPESSTKVDSSDNQSDVTGSHLISGSSTSETLRDEMLSNDTGSSLNINDETSASMVSASHEESNASADNPSDQGGEGSPSTNSLTVDTLSVGGSNLDASPPSPGGREVKVEKDQACLEDDIFRDCWSDFSNTLQEVLNRLQELSSELGQSKLLATTPGSEEAQQDLSKKNPTFDERVKMKEGRKTNKASWDKATIFPHQEKGKCSHAEKVTTTSSSSSSKSCDDNSPTTPSHPLPEEGISNPTPECSYPLPQGVSDTPLQKLGATTRSQGRDDPRLADSIGGGVAPPLHVGGNSASLHQSGLLYMPSEDHKSKTSQVKLDESSSTSSAEGGSKSPHTWSPSTAGLKGQNVLSTDGFLGPRVPRPTSLFLGNDPGSSLLPGLRKNSPVEALQESFLRRNSPSCHKSPPDVHYLPVEVEARASVPVCVAQGSDPARSDDKPKLSPDAQSSIWSGRQDICSDSSHDQSLQPDGLSERTFPNKGSAKVEYSSDSEEEKFCSRSESPVTVSISELDSVSVSDEIGKKQVRESICQPPENEAKNPTKIDDISISDNNQLNFLNNLNYSRVKLNETIRPYQPSKKSNFQPNIDYLDSPESNLTDENEHNSPLYEEEIVEGKLSIPLSSFSHQPSKSVICASPIQKPSKPFQPHGGQSDVTACNSDVNGLKIPSDDVMGGEHLPQASVGRPRVDDDNTGPPPTPLSPPAKESSSFLPAKKQCQSSLPRKEGGHAEPFRPLRREMGGVFSRTKPSDLSRPSDSPPVSPSLKSAPGGGTQHYPFRTAARSRERAAAATATAVPDPAPVPSYVRQRSEPSRRYSGFAHVTSDNVKRMRDVWGSKQDRRPDSQPPSCPPSPLSKFSSQVPPSSPTRNPSRRISDLASDSHQWRKSSPVSSSYHGGESPSPIERLGRVSYGKRSPSPTPLAGRVASVSPNRSRNSPSRTPSNRTPLQDYQRKASSSPYRSQNPTSGLRNTNGRSPSPARRRNGHSPPEKGGSPPSAPSPVRRRTAEEFKENVSTASPTSRRRNNEPSSRTDRTTRPDSMPTRFDHQQPSAGGYSPKEPAVSRTKSSAEHRASPAPKAHQRIFKRFRNANLLPNSEAICFKEEEDKYKMVLDVEEYVPGEIEVLQDDKVLTVKGRVETKESGNHVSVRTFNRTFNIPRNTREEEIDSALSEDGILTIFVPKKKERIIKIELVD